MTAVNPAASLPLKNTVNEDSGVKTQDGIQRNAVKYIFSKIKKFLTIGKTILFEVAESSDTLYS